MQLTRFDRWLREKFVYEMHIQTLRPPESIPSGIRVVELPDSPGKRFKHLFVARNSRSADALLHVLRENNQMYQTQIVDRDAWWIPFVAPKERSVTWWIISAIVFSCAAFLVLIYIKGLVQDPEFRKNFMEAVDLFKS